MNTLKKAAVYVAGALVVVALMYAALTPRAAVAQDSTYGPKVYKDQGGDRENVASGGSIVVYSGGTLDVSAGTLTLAAGQIATAGLAANAVTNAKLAADAASLAKVSNSALAVSGTSVTVAAAFLPGSKTKAQLLAYNPGGAGEIWFCSDCSTDGVVVSTGTGLGAVARISARTTVIN